jgi:hypothetical protein
MDSFVEDRLATLKNVIKDPELDGWNLYLGNHLPQLFLFFTVSPFVFDATLLQYN